MTRSSTLFKYTKNRQNTVHAVHEKVTGRENYTVLYLYKLKYNFKMNTTSFCCYMYLSIPNEHQYKDFDGSVMI